MITRIESPNELKGETLYRMYSVSDEAEALQIVGEAKGLLYQSRIVKGFYLFVEV